MVTIKYSDQSIIKKAERELDCVQNEDHIAFAINLALTEGGVI